VKQASTLLRNRRASVWVYRRRTTCECEGRELLDWRGDTLRKEEREGRKEHSSAFRTVAMATPDLPGTEAEIETEHEISIEPEAEAEVENQRESTSTRSEAAEKTETAQQILQHDSMVTVRLSEPPPVLTVDTRTNIIQRGRKDTIGEEDIRDGDVVREEESPRIMMMDPDGEVLSPTGSESASDRNPESRRGSDSSEASVEGGGVNWEELEKTEEKEPRDESSDDVSLCLSMIRDFADGLFSLRRYCLLDLSRRITF